MSFEKIRETVRTARKDHSCIWCNMPIEAGEKYLDRAYKFEGSFYTDKLHLDCNEALGNSDDLDGFEPYNQYRGKTMKESEDIRDKEIEAEDSLSFCDKAANL